MLDKMAANIGCVFIIDLVTHDRIFLGRGGGGGGGAVAQSVERATPGQEVPGSIPAVAARSLLVDNVTG